MNRRTAALALLLTTGAACGGEAGPASSTMQVPTSSSTVPIASSSPTTTSTPEAVVAPVAPEPLWQITIDGAISMNVAASPEHDPVVAWITTDAVLFTTVDPNTGALSNPVPVNGSIEPIGHPIERPALALGTGGTVDVAFTSFVGSGGTVFYARWQDGEVSEPTAISGPPEPETNLVHLALDDAGRPILAWLEDSTLSVATSEAGTPTELELVDDLTCDCCNPVPMLHGGELTVAYRDLVETDGAPYRDVAIVRSAGEGFGEPVTVADDHWAIAACPFTGPSMVSIDGDLVMAWMDARQSVHPAQDATTIWVDRSVDGGRSFGTDVAVTDGSGIHRWPVMAVDGAGTIHLVWQTQGSDGGLSYTHSSDGGRSFTSARLISPGAVQAPSIAHQDGLLIVTWSAQGVGQVAAWPVEALVGR